jgi:hypothetical protein
LSTDDNDGELPYIPSDAVAPINIQFQIIGDNHSYYGAGGLKAQKEASENISISGNILFTGSLNKVQGVTFSNDTWNIPIIPTMSLAGGCIEIAATWEGFGSIFEYLEIGGTNYLKNGTIVTVTPQEFEFGTDQTFTVDLDYADGSSITSGSLYLYYIDDGEVEKAGDPLQGHTISMDTDGFDGYSLGLNKTQQNNNQTEAGFPSIKAPRNLSIFSVTYIGPTPVYGWALVRMKPADLIQISIKRGLRRFIRVEIENIGLVNADNIKWNVIVTRRGLFKRTILDISGNISTIEEGLSEKIFERAFGFSLIKVTVNATGPCINPVEKTVKGFIFLRFVRIRRFFEFLNFN